MTYENVSESVASIISLPWAKVDKPSHAVPDVQTQENPTSSIYSSPRDSAQNSWCQILWCRSHSVVPLASFVSSANIVVHRNDGNALAYLQYFYLSIFNV